MAKDIMAIAKGKLAGMKVGSHYAAAKVNAVSASIKRRRDNMDADIHAAAVASIYLSMPKAEGGDCNGEPARQLMNAIPRGIRAKTLTDWFEANSNIRLSFDKKAGEYKVKMVAPSDPEYRKATPDRAFDRPFWTAKEKTDGAKVFLVQNAMANMVAAVKRYEDGKGGMSDTDYANAKLLIAFANENHIAVTKAA